MPSLRFGPFVAVAVLVTGCANWSPAFDANGNWFMNVSGRSGSDVYAVGGTNEKGAVRHFDGNTWSEVELGVDVPLLNWVFPFSTDDVFAVGNAGTILHFDGHTWTKAMPLTEDPIWGVWGAAPNDVWAVGGSGFGSSEPLLLHYDGTSWTKQTVPELSRQNVYALYKVWGTSADNVLVVGQDGALLRFNGTEWHEEETGAKDDLISLWGTGPDHIVAVGGRGNGIVSVWNGKSWTTKSLSPLPGLNGVWMSSDRFAWVAGGNATLGQLNLDTLEVSPDELDTTLDLHSVFGVDGKVYAVGGNLLIGASTGKYQGVALERPQ